MKTIINLIMIFLISMASVMAYGGGGSSYLYFKTETDKKTQTKLTHFNLNKKSDIEIKIEDFTFKLNTKELKYVDLYETKNKSIVFRTNKVKSVLITDKNNVSLVIDTNKEYTLKEIKEMYIMKSEEKASFTFLKEIKKEMFGMEHKGTYLVTTKYGQTQVSIFE